MAETETKFLGPDKLPRRIVAQTVQSGDAPEVRLRKLYARAQAIRNLDFEALPGGEARTRLAPEESENVEDVLTSGTGSSTEINLTFLSLARAAGFEATSAYLASRDIQTFDPRRLDPNQLNTTAVWVRLGDKELLLDPGTPFCAYGMLPWQKALAGGLRLEGETVKGLSTRATRPQDSRIERSTELQLSPDGRLHGTMQVRFFGQQALELRLQNLGLTEQERADHLSTRIREWMSGSVSMEHLTASGWDSSEDPLSADLQISLSAAPGPDHGVLLPLFVSVARHPNPFVSSVRDYPVYFKYPFEEVDHIRVVLPLGMTWEHPLSKLRFTFDLPGMRISPPVESGAASLRRRTPGDVVGAAFLSTPVRQGDSLVVDRALFVAVGTVRLEDYSKLRDFFAGVTAADAEAVAIRLAVASPH